MAHYVIVGGVAGGMSTAARLRRLDETANIVVFERGEHVSFANCGLPYYVSGVIDDRAKLLVQTAESLRSRLNLDIRLHTTVLAIDREAKTVMVENESGQRYVEPYDFMVLAPGAEPLRPPLPGLDHPKVFTIRSIPDIDRVKNSLTDKTVSTAVIIGGGFIGLEMADNLHKTGVNVHLVEMTHQVLPAMLDPDMAALVHNHLRTKGIKLHLGSPVQELSPQNESLSVTLGNGNQLMADMVVLAIGVRPDIALAKDAGLEIGPRGGMVVDNHLRTSDPSIYAVGDAIEVCDLVTGNPAIIPLAGPANKQGRMVADNIMGLDRTYSGTQGTAIVDALGLTVAGTGANSFSLQRAGIKHAVSITHSFPHATYYPGGSMMTIKLLFASDSGKLLGAQAVGVEGVDKRIDVLATTLRFGGTVQQLQELELAYAPPFSSAKDPVNIAGYAASNLLNRHSRVVQASDVPNLLGTATFLDVRDESEHLIGAIEGSINIPLPQLRARLAEVPKDKPVVVYCRVGHQAYVASRMLMQNGYSNVQNLMGGWRTYNAIQVDNRAIATPSPRNQNPTGAQVEIAAAHLEEDPTMPKQPSGIAACRMLDVTGLSCPGPIAQVHKVMDTMAPGGLLEVHASDPGFTADIAAWCSRTGNNLVSFAEAAGQLVVKLCKGNETPHVDPAAVQDIPHDKTMVVFSGDLDKALAAFVIATGAAAMNRKVTMFFTFWGLNVLRRTEKVSVRKGFMDKMFGMMMPRGSRKLGLSRMNMAGIGPKLIRSVMNGKNISSVEELMQLAIQSGVRIVACQMSMDVMGIKKEELLPGVEIGGVATYLAAAEVADTNLFI